LLRLGSLAAVEFPFSNLSQPLACGAAKSVHVTVADGHRKDY